MTGLVPRTPRSVVLLIAVLSVGVLIAGSANAAAQSPRGVETTVLAPAPTSPSATPANAPIEATISVDPSEPTADQSATFSVSVTGGTSPYTYDWTELPNGCTTPETVASFTCVPDEQEDALVYVSVTDFNGNDTEAEEYVEVQAALTVSITIDPDPTVVDESTTFEAVAEGGSEPYTYDWEALPVGCDLPQSDYVFTCTPIEEEDALVEVLVTDDHGNSTQADVYLEVTETSLSASIDITPTPVEAGTATTFSAYVTGGTEPYTYDWTDLPEGCTLPQYGQSVVCTPDEEEDAFVEVEVTDETGGVTYADTYVDILAPEGAGILADPVTGPAPLPVQFYGYLNGSYLGTDAYSYNWSFGDHSPGSTFDDPNHEFNASGTYIVTLVVTVLESGQSYSTHIAVIVGAYKAPPKINSFTATPSDPTIGQVVYFHLNATGGVGYLDYGYETELPCLQGFTQQDLNSTHWGCTTLTVGSFLVVAEVRDIYDRNATAEIVVTVVAPGTSGSGGQGDIIPGMSPLDTGLSVAVVGLAVVSSALAIGLARTRRAPPPSGSSGITMGTPPPPPPLEGHGPMPVPPPE